MRRFIPLALVATLLMAPFVQAQTPPARTITIIDGYAPGGMSDVLSRMLAEKMSKSLGQPVIVEARPGASGTIGAAAVARAKPDGYTIFVGNPGPNAIAASAFTKLPYDVERDLEPIGLAGTLPLLFCVPANSPIHTPADLVAAGKTGANVNFGSPGYGGLSHLAGELFNREAGTKYKHIAYRGGPQLSVALITGEVQMAVMTGGDVLPHVRAGKVRCIANAGAKRSSLYPDVPTFSESGLPGVQADVWLGYFAPAKTPKAIVQKLNAAIRGALAEPDVTAKLQEMALTPAPGSPEELAARIHDERSRYGAVVKAIGLKLD
ncbi:MAG: tripartite tricarboxylate transporter substrate binding protein [Gemmobacter sp.]|nr:tripartite tricarboxylate transporter substrate binding protein [Gemmobacter sp.]